MKSTKQVPYARTDFGEAPEGYIAGLGRGAVGFITRSDVGPAAGQASLNPNAIKPPPGFLPSQNKQHLYQDVDIENLNENMFDAWSGYGGGKIFKFQDDAEDKEAERIYDEIDGKMDERRKSRRDLKIRQELKKMEQESLSTSQQFADLKRNLSSLSYDDWMNIPEVVDQTIKKTKIERYIPVPDSVIESGRKEGQIKTSINLEGSETPIGNLNEAGTARQTLLNMILDKKSGTVTGTSTVDKKGYLTDLSSIPINSESDIGDFKKARAIVKSIIKCNPKNADGYISAARVEELDGKIQQAKEFLALGLQNNETSEDLWLEAARLEKNEKAKATLAKAVSIIPKSIKIWMAACALEKDEEIKKRILKKALEHIPNSLQLWKELIELESNENKARELLYKAVECVPGCLEMWLALAKLETYENAKNVINNARKQLPTEHAIWIAAAKLEETQGNGKDKVEQVISKGIKILKKNQYVLNKEEWIDEAIIAEMSGSPLTARGIIYCVLGEGLVNADKKRVVLEDLNNFVARSSMTCARACYELLLEKFEYAEDLILTAIEIEKKYGVQSQGDLKIQELLAMAVRVHPSSEQFWIMHIKALWKNTEVCRQEIVRALDKLSGSQDILLLRAKLEIEENNLEQAREVLAAAKNLGLTGKANIQAIKLELKYDNLDRAWEESQIAIKQYPKEEKIFLLASKVARQLKGIAEARLILEKGVKFNPLSLPLWQQSIIQEIENREFARARPLIEKARLKLQKCPELWNLAIRLEQSAGDRKAAIFNLSKALKECPQNGELWSLAVELEPKSTRKKKILDALDACQDDPLVNLSVAKLFWKEKKHEKTKKWLEKAVFLNKNIADSWAYLYWFHVTVTNEKEEAQKIHAQIITEKPKLGRLWQQVKKSEEILLLKDANKYEWILQKVTKLIDKELSLIE